MAPPARALRGFHKCVQLGFSTSDEALFGPLYAAKCAAKDAATTSSALGLRLSGAQGWWTDPSGGKGGGGAATAWRAPRAACKALRSSDDVTRLLGWLFLSRAGALPSAARDCAALSAWLHSQTAARFFGASVLLVFDADDTGGCAAGCAVRLVDFAHTLVGRGPDGGSAPGAAALAGMLQQLQTRGLNAAERGVPEPWWL